MEEDKILREWWEEDAQDTVNECLSYIADRKVKLRDFSKSIREQIQEDDLLLKAMANDVHDIRFRLSLITNPMLKYKKEFFLARVKHNQFNFYQCLDTISKIQQDSRELIREYEHTERVLLRIKNFFEKTNKKMSIDVIDKATESISVVGRLDRICTGMANLFLQTQDSRDECLDNMEDYLDEIEYKFVEY